MKIFDNTSFRKPSHSAFDLSHEQKLSFNMGDLVPTYFQEILPGDEFKVKSEIMLRMAPMVAPVMHRVNVYMHYFFVPNRIIWNAWEEYITNGRLGTYNQHMTTIDYPSVGISSYKLCDYLGLPRVDLNASEPSKISTLPFRAYTQIYDDYYRDPNLHYKIDVTTAGTSEFTKLRRRCWEKDYFTSALPWPQRGPEVDLPIAGSFAPEYKDITSAYDSGTNNLADGDLAADTGVVEANGGSVELRNLEPSQDVDMESLSINELRKSNALQRFLEKNAKGGARYIEMIKSHFGVSSKDSRLQRAEYLGGGRAPVVMSEVLNTTGTEDAPQGTMAGHGISVGNTNTFRRKFDEHGFVFGIMSVMPKTGYAQGIDRLWSRDSHLDFAWPDFANLGEQEVKNKELYYTATDSDADNGTFGYQQRFAEYKYKMNTVHGDFRTNLNYWHLARLFDDRPALNTDFMESDPSNRIFAVTDEDVDSLWCQVYHDVKARRKLPYFANPSL